jgi:hypothetical protein
MLYTVYKALHYIITKIGTNVAGNRAQPRHAHVFEAVALHCRYEEVDDDCASPKTDAESHWAATCIFRAFRAWKDRQHFKRHAHSYHRMTLLEAEWVSEKEPLF